MKDSFPRNNGEVDGYISPEITEAQAAKLAADVRSKIPAANQNNPQVVDVPSGEFVHITGESTYSWLSTVGTRFTVRCSMKDETTTLEVKSSAAMPDGKKMLHGVYEFEVIERESPYFDGDIFETDVETGARIDQTGHSIEGLTFDEIDLGQDLAPLSDENAFRQEQLVYAEGTLANCTDENRLF